MNRHGKPIGLGVMTAALGECASPYPAATHLSATQAHLGT